MLSINQFLLILFVSCAAQSPSRKYDVPTEGNRSLNLHVGFYVESLSNLNAATMAFDMDMYLRMSWRDLSIAHNSTTFELRDSRKSQWMPDLYMMNALSATFQEVTQPNFLLGAYPNGTVAYSTRVTLNVACPMMLRDYPHDRQTCYVRMSAYRYTESQLRISWFPTGAIEYNPEISLPEFVIADMRTADCTGLFTYGKHINGSMKGRFGCVEGRLLFERSMGYHLVQTYIPTSLIVVISWVSFWIDRSAVPARITLSFTTLLTLATQSSSVRVGLPPVSYAKAIDYWMAMCMLFVFGGLLEFAAVNSMNQTASKFASMAAGGQAISAKKPKRPWLIVIFLSMTGGQTKSTEVARILNNPPNGPTKQLDSRKESKSSQDHSLKLSGNKANVINLSFKPIQKSFDINGQSASQATEESDAELKQFYTQLSQDYNDVALRVDNLSRVMFPASFMLFVAGYMCHYAARLF